MREYSGACFSAQQAAEKALKAFLLFKGKLLKKIHDTAVLLADCIEIDHGFKKLERSTKKIFPYYATTRYPFDGQLFVFDKVKATEAFKAAQEIINFVEKKLS